MKISKLIGERLKETPSGVMAKSHEFLIRAGYIKQVCNGVYSLLPPAMRIQQKIVRIIREEMNKIDGQEVLFPVLMPRELWEESGRYTSIGNEMFRLKDRSEHDLVLGMTHEEAAIHMAKNTMKSYEQLPFMIYQIQTKLRDEPRARAGLIRVREFTMKDAYSFHNTLEDLNEYYEKVYQSYKNIFLRIGMKNFIVVQSDSGMMGGKVSHEFMSLLDIGEDSLVLCDKCDYQANNEVATSKIEKNQHTPEKLKEINTGVNKTIEEIAKLFNVSMNKTCKAVVYYGLKSKKFIVAFIRGDLDINEVKLRNSVKEEIVIAEDLDGSGLIAGQIGPLNLPKNVISVFDKSLENEKNLIVGGNKKEIHITGFSFERDIQVENFVDISLVKEGDFCSKCNSGKLKIKRGVEIGQIFQLGTRYTQSMKMTIHNEKGEEFNPIMGCYGIGVGRAIACVAEEHCDEKGLVWPLCIAPWQIYLCPLKMPDEKIKSTSKKIYEKLTKEGFEVLFDDRDVSAGVKFADSELMGIPLRILISQKSLEKEQVEISIRKTGEKIMTEVKDLTTKLKQILSTL